MPRKHPIIAVTGSSGAGTTSVLDAFELIFRKENVQTAFVQGDGFHKYDRHAMDEMAESSDSSHITHFGPDGNLFEELEASFKSYTKTGVCRRRYYVHDQIEAAQHGALIGTMTEWESTPNGTDLMFYEGLHGGLITEKANIAQYVSLLVGVTPIINLEWAQKIQRDRTIRGHSAETSTRMILQRMHDYIHYIAPQFSRTDINFQRVPTIDTSNPFSAEQHIPSTDESLCVVHIRNLNKVQVNFRYLLEMLEGSFMSAPDTLVIPAGKQNFCIQLIITPIIKKLANNK